MWLFNRIDKNKFERIKKEYRQIKVNDYDITFYYQSNPIALVNYPLFNLGYCCRGWEKSKHCYEGLDELEKEVKIALDHKNKRTLARIYYDIAKYIGQALAKTDFDYEKRYEYTQGLIKWFGWILRAQ